MSPPRGVGALQEMVRQVTSGGRTLFFVALTALNVLNMATHLVTSRLLGPGAYGGLAAVLGVLAVISVPLAAVQAAVVHGAAGNPTASARALLLRSGSYGAGAAALWLAGASWIAGFLHLSIATVLLAAPWVLLSVVNVTLEGVLIGRSRFRTAAWGLLLGTGVARLVMAITLVALGAGVNGGVVASSIGSAVTTGLLLRGVRDGPGVERLQIARADVVRALGGVSGVTLLTSLDAWLARHFLAAVPAGLFSAAATVGRTALFLPAALLMVFFPRFAASDGRGPAALGALGSALLATAAMSFGLAAFMISFPHLVATAIFGDRFGGSAAVVGLIGTADACVACTTVLIYFHMARRSPLASGAWIGCGLTVVLALLFHRSAHALAGAMLAANAATLLATLLATAVVAKRDRRTSGVWPSSTIAGPAGA